MNEEIFNEREDSFVELLGRARVLDSMISDNFFSGDQDTPLSGIRATIEANRNLLIEDLMRKYGYSRNDIEEYLLSVNPTILGTSIEIDDSTILSYKILIKEKADQLIQDICEYSSNFKIGEKVLFDDPFNTNTGLSELPEVEIIEKKRDEDSVFRYKFKMNDGSIQEQDGCFLKLKNHLDVKTLLFIVREMELDIIKSIIKQGIDSEEIEIEED